MASFRWIRISIQRPAGHRAALESRSLGRRRRRPFADRSGSVAVRGYPAAAGRVTTSLLHRRQRVRIAGQEPAAPIRTTGSLAVHRHPIAGELRRLLFFGDAWDAWDAWDHGQRVPAPRVGDFADDHDLFQIADATDPRPFV